MYVDIAVVLESYRDAGSHLQVGCSIAKALTARLVVLDVHGAKNPPIGLIIGPESSVVAAERSALQTVLAEVEQKKAFEEMVARSGISWVWRNLEVPLTSRVARHARRADLVLLFRPGRSASIVDAARIVMESGRPAILMPSDQRRSPLPFGRIVVAWNGSREASRAVHDAMPFLQQAERVVVATVPETSLFVEEHEPGPDICDHLARHGVRSELHRPATTEQEPGAALLSVAAAASADLIVAGCYGHMRLTEFIFGGVSRTLLESATIPLLLSS